MTIDEEEEKEFRRNKGISDSKRRGNQGKETGNEEEREKGHKERSDRRGVRRRGRETRVWKENQ